MIENQQDKPQGIHVAQQLRKADKIRKIAFILSLPAIVLAVTSVLSMFGVLPAEWQLKATLLMLFIFSVNYFIKSAEAQILRSLYK
ncbi:hypothetical protein H8F21_14070 [Pseudomonas sp. P66]|uniref:Orphan protein n=1 Tax=Pseudomonas arcuscaelestis TaxID=2710591 RepID=A0ABS2C0C6_9PSED|nr:hypothetical protein [Pseudomonas arcuscaelestis]MBM5458691.1 hypothetical protein [Pseudomonas arcuscaelestis]